MKLGTGLITAQRRPDDDRSMEEIYDEVLAYAAEADAVGLDSVWTSEHHFTDDGYLPATLPALAAIGTATESLEIGSCVALAPLYNGVRLAEDAATVDLLSNGRLTLGLAIGSNPREFEAFGIPREERVERLEDVVALCRAAWSDGPLEYDPEFHDVSPDVSVTPTPTNGDVPIMLGGKAKPAVRRAARIGDAWCAPSSISLAGVRKRVEDIRSVRQAEGLEDPFTVYVLQHGFVDESADAAWEAMEGGYLYIQRRYAEIFSGEPVPELPPERREALEEQAIVGTPETVTAELETYRETLEPIVEDMGGELHFIFRTYHPGIGTERMLECVRLLGESVAPELRSNNE